MRGLRSRTPENLFQFPTGERDVFCFGKSGPALGLTHPPPFLVVSRGPLSGGEGSKTWSWPITIYLAKRLGLYGAVIPLPQYSFWVHIKDFILTWASSENSPIYSVFLNFIINNPSWPISHMWPQPKIFCHQNFVNVWNVNIVGSNAATV